MIGCLYNFGSQSDWGALVTAAAQLGPMIDQEPSTCVWFEWPDMVLPCVPKLFGLGVATTRWAARVAASNNIGMVAPGTEAQAVAAVPVHGIDLAPESHRKLRWLGLTQLKHVAELPPEALAELLGPDGKHLEILARGEDPTWHASHVTDEAPVSEITLEGGEDDAGFLLYMIKTELGKLYDQLQQCEASFNAVKVTFEGTFNSAKTLVVRWNTTLSDKQGILAVVLERLSHVALLGTPSKIIIEPLGIIKNYRQQLSLGHAAPKCLDYFADLERRGRLRGVMRAIIDNMRAPLPDEVAHLEGLSQPDINKPLCVPRELQAYVGPTPSSCTIYASWEIHMRWWQERPVWRRYMIAGSDQRGPMRIFQDQYTGRWFRH